MLTKTQRLLLSSLIIWPVFYYFFIDTIPQFYWVSVVVFQILFLAALYLNKSDATKLSKKRIAFVIVSMLLSIRLAVYTQATLYPINLFLLIVINGLLYTEEGKKFGRYTYWFSVIMKRRVLYIGSWISSVWRYCNELFGYLWAMFHIPKEKNETIREILIWLVLLGVSLLIIVPLLSAADLWFGALVDGVFWWLRPQNLLSYLWANFWRVVLIVLSVLLWYCVFKHYSAKVNDFEIAPKKEITISELRSKIVFYGLNIVYLIFVIMQFRFLFLGSHETIVSRWFESYASYIHRWFRQLITVACINIWIYKIFESHWKKTRWVISLLILCGCTWVIIMSALLRTSAYIQAYWLTLLRALVIMIAIWFMIVFGYLVVRIYTKKYSLLSVVTSIFMIVRIVFWFINIDASIAKYNINAYLSLPSDYEQNRQEYGSYKKSTVLDMKYLAWLSADAADVLIHAYESWIFWWDNSNEAFNNDYTRKNYLERYAGSSSWYHWNYYSSKAQGYLELYE
jgi:hypothetical protein